MSLKENEIIQHVLLTISKSKGNFETFKSSITSGDYSSKSCSFFTRTLIWKGCLITKSLNINEWESRLHDSRVVYHQLTKRSDMQVPWWELSHDHYLYQTKQDLRKTASIRRKQSQSFRSPTPSAAPRRSSSLSGKTTLARIKNIDHDPLQSMSRSSTPSPGGEEMTPTEQDIELLQAIVLDIDRLFPGEEFFQNSNGSSATSSSGTSATHSAVSIKRHLVEILYVWSKCNLGYKQGIHEILGLIYYSLYQESIFIPQTNTISVDDLKILKLYDLNYLNHDLFTILNGFIMTSGIFGKFYENETNLLTTIEDFNIKFMKIDQFIHYNLTSKLKLESQLWIIRYLRLLLLREIIDLETTISIWDKLIASSVSIPDLILFMIIQLLIQIKPDLIASDFSECLSLLLHYPIKKTIKENNSPEIFINNLYKDSIKLYQARNEDLKLYELGNKLNVKYNPNLKISMSYTNSARSSMSSINSNGSTTRVSSEISTSRMESKAEKLQFEKMRLEMRLKKKAQEMIKH
ncbi:TBC1 domain family member 5 [Spathaspora sp. JA1]|nr:TBC1 domain family member 5 [Spathaspora sp. JA1]